MLQAYNHLEQTCKHPDDVKLPKFTVIIAQKIHHTKLFQYSDTTNVPSGVSFSGGIILLFLLCCLLFLLVCLVFSQTVSLSLSPGTVVDTEIVHPINYDFYICSHAGMIVRFLLLLSLPLFELI